jgi:hypothetical protein
MMREERGWHREVISPAVGEILTLLGSQQSLDAFYLAGGTALALHFGHRRSADLDFFTDRSFDEERLVSSLQSRARISVVAKDRQTVHLHVDGVKVSLLGYAYPVLFPFRSLSGIEVADPRDIACMKISAIASGGTRRDFVDVYVAAQQYGLDELVRLFRRKYAAANYNLVHLVKSLTYFADAEREPQPDMLLALSWDQVKHFFKAEVPRLSQS